jgi:CubicO group peptidase (beta-lactamase class C family)
MADGSAVGIDTAALHGILGRLRNGNAVPGIHSLVVVRYGYVVTEEYYAGTTDQTVHTAQSISKSVTSLLVGIAHDRGALPSLDTKLLGFFPEYSDLAYVDEAKRAVTVHDLMTMRSGISFWEDPYDGSPLQQLNTCHCDWLRLVLDRPMAAAPGAMWAYNSGGVIVLGGVLRAATSETADQFADHTLFVPLGIKAWAWTRGQPNGLPHMGGGLALRATELARIGYLVLMRGVWNGTQIVSNEWLTQSTARSTTLTPAFFPYNSDYGLLWWLFPRNGMPGSASGDDYIVAAVGTGGQWLFIDRQKKLVVVINGALGSSTSPGIRLFMDMIEPAVKLQR